MNKYLRLLLIMAIAITVMKTGGAAEGQSQEDSVFQGIKARMVSSYKENVRLAEENKKLKEELIGLQLEIERYERDIKRLDPRYMQAREVSRKQKEESSGLKAPRSGDLVKEAQSIYLSGQLLALDDVQKLKELYLYDLQYQKQDLELQLKSMEFLHQKVSEHRGPQLDALETEIGGNEARMRRLVEEIAEQEKVAMAYPQEIEFLKMENRSLQKRIDHLKRVLE
jgi:regulator of replication initiation timing